MPDLDREFTLLAASAERTARVQRDEVRRFIERAPRGGIPTLGDGSKEPNALARPLRHGAALARHVSGAYDAMLAHVAQRRLDYETLHDDLARRGAVNEMRQIVTGARGLHGSLAWLDAASRPPLDLGTRYLVDSITAQLVSREAEVTVVTGERSYGTMANPFSPVFNLSGAPPPNNELAIVVFVPRNEQNSGLLHPLIVHELGHAAEGRHSFVRSVTDTAARDHDLMQRLTEAADAQAAEDGIDRAASGQSIGTRLASWLEEVVCDTFAAQLLGPTYLYSFMTIVGTSDIDQPGEYHPPARVRLRLIVNQLDALGWADVMRDSCPAVDGWFRETIGQEVGYDGPEFQYCVMALLRLAGHVSDTIRRHMGDRVFSAARFAPLKDEISELLSAGIPPSQTLDGRRITRPAVILGSWLYAIGQEGDELSSLASAADVLELSRLLPKALEDAAVLKEWGFA